MEKTETKSKLIGGIIPIWFVWVLGIGIVGTIIWAAFIRVPKYGKKVKVEDNDGDGKPDDFDPTSHTDRLKSDLIGLNATGHDDALHSEVLNLSNGKIEAIYADWQRRVAPTLGGYMPGSGTTGDSLAKTIADETAIWGTSFSSFQQTYKQKFDSLNLR